MTSVFNFFLHDRSVGVAPPQMKELAGSDGIIIVGFWNGNKFGDALQNFYFKHPELCGTMKDADINFDDRHLDTAEGYHTHWTTPEEAYKVVHTAYKILCRACGWRRVGAVICTPPFLAPIDSL